MKISPSVSGKAFTAGLGYLSYVCDHNVSMLKGTTFLRAALNEDCPNVSLYFSVYRRCLKIKQEKFPLYSYICGTIGVDRTSGKRTVARKTTYMWYKSVTQQIT
jgi:hypothetical protein